jgi:hypothetical protein
MTDRTRKIIDKCLANAVNILLIIAAWITVVILIS